MIEGCAGQGCKRQRNSTVAANIFCSWRRPAVSKSSAFSSPAHSSCRPSVAPRLPAYSAVFASADAGIRRWFFETTKRRALPPGTFAESRFAVKGAAAGYPGSGIRPPAVSTGRSRTTVSSGEKQRLEEPMPLSQSNGNNQVAVKPSPIFKRAQRCVDGPERSWRVHWLLGLQAGGLRVLFHRVLDQLSTGRGEPRPRWRKPEFSARAFRSLPSVCPASSRWRAGLD